MNRNHERPISEPIQLSGVWEMDSIDQADGILGRQTEGFVYRRDGHPNAASLEQTLRQMHGADHCIVTAQGMSAISAACLALLEPGAEVLLGQPLYGKTSYLVKSELSRWGVRHQDVDACDLSSWQNALRPSVRMVIVETITNPRLSVPDLEAIVNLVKSVSQDIVVMVDNTFATPALCQPMRWGADLVMESLSKFVCGHGDVMLGMLAGNDSIWKRIRPVVSAFGLASSPLDCWLTTRGLATLSVRMKQASFLANDLATRLSGHAALDGVDYPGLQDNPSYETATRLLNGSFGNMVTIHLKEKLGRDNKATAQQFIERIAHVVPFCPSLGDAKTTLSHPKSTSHRSYTADELSQLGVHAGTIRFSCGLEEPDDIIPAIEKALNEPM
ncbi:trans-sulfuration enzyme family protein [Pirellulaceae bacterium SH449]